MLSYKCAYMLIDCSVFFLVSKESAGGIDEEDFIKAFTDVPPVQVHHTQEHKCIQSHTLLPFNNQTI